MKKIIFFISIFLIVILGNVFSMYINVFTEGLFVRYHFQTEKCEFEHELIATKGDKLTRVEKESKQFKLDNEEYSHLELYRTYQINPLKFWNWYSYMTNEFYKFEYKEKCTTAIHASR